MSGTLGSLASNTHLATRNPKFRTEIESECGKNLFFGLHLNLGVKFRTEMELLSLTKLRKNISPPRNLFNQQKLDAYGHMHVRKTLRIFVIKKISICTSNLTKS